MHRFAPWLENYLLETHFWVTIPGEDRLGDEHSRHELGVPENGGKLGEGRVVSNVFLTPKGNIAPEKWWLED